MAGRDGRGSLRRRLKDHATGQIVNMFAQYLLFARLLDAPDRPRTPREAAIRCKTYIRQHCYARILATSDAQAARALEIRLRRELSPSFNRVSSASPAEAHCED